MKRNASRKPTHTDGTLGTVTLRCLGDGKDFVRVGERKASPSERRWMFRAADASCGSVTLGKPQPMDLPIPPAGYVWALVPLKT
jgi:hypothetical protein